jgi:2-oxoglutarate ferredoxin oxidoreductase subunit beta
MSEVMQRRGFCFIEVISPCPTLYQRRNKMGDGLDAMKYYKAASKVKNGISANEAPMTRDGEIIVGKFVDRERPDYMELMRNRLSSQLGEKYIEVDNVVCSS